MTSPQFTPSKEETHYLEVTSSALTMALCARDRQTAEHCGRVQRFALDIGRFMNLSSQDLYNLKFAALLHDIGKLQTPDAVLGKPEALNDLERETMRLHANYGSFILSGLGFPHPIYQIVQEHHERWDGEGYPTGIFGDYISLGARIVAVADAFDAMTSPRAYQTSKTPAQARDEILSCAGTQFDPAIVEVFLISPAIHRGAMNKQQITKSLEDWARKKKRVDKINADADRQLQPHLETYEKKTESIVAARDEKLADLVPQMERLEHEIRTALLSQVTADGTAPAPIDIDPAVAEVTVDRKREIDAATFMRAVPPRLRCDPKFIGCLSVLVGKAEKFLDATTLARVVRPKLTHSVALTLKSE